MDENSQKPKGEVNREQAIFYAALEQSPEERAGFLKGACMGDDQLRQRVEALLEANENPESLLGDLTADATHESPFHDEAVGQTLGRYKLLERVGEGGYGVVYVAEQTEPVRRRVALKVIKLGMDTKQVVARFEAERQALALMDHPNIAKVLDAGTTDQGRPYFVMELVRGVKITDYCDQEKMSTKDRLDLFIKVCHAIQHAHQKGIIHRDIKPSNILVTLHDGVPIPKVIDFGIAKATEGRLTDATIYTQLHQFIGTPAYMSPEQAEMSGLDIDTRSDIYSLGVLLYELLIGKTPFDGKELVSMGIDAMRKTIRESEPARPSTRLATLIGEELTSTATRRSSEISTLAHLLKGDLDWIVMKCLEKDRQRRYETANALAADIKRHLSNEPIVARPPSAIYKFQKAWRRNKMVYSSGATVLLALVLATGVSLYEMSVAFQARDEAKQATKNADKARLETENEAKIAQEERDKALIAQQEAKHNLYAADMNRADQAINFSNFGLAKTYLERNIPNSENEDDPRGWEWKYLWSQCQSDHQEILWKGDHSIYVMALSKNQQWLAFREEAPKEEANKIIILDINSGQPLADFPFSGVSNIIEFSPTSDLLGFIDWAQIEGTNDPFCIHLWDLPSGKTLHRLPIPGSRSRIKFSKDGKHLVSLCQLRKHGTAEIFVWNVTTGELEFKSKPIKGSAGQGLGDNLAVTTNLDMVAFGFDSGEVGVYSLEKDAFVWKHRGAIESVLSVAFSPDDRFLCSGAGLADSSICFWDTKTGEKLASVDNHESLVLALRFWPDGKTLTSSSGDQTIRIWDISDLTSIPEPHVLRGHESEIMDLEPLSDGKTLISGSKDGTIREWNISAAVKKRKNEHLLPVQILAYQFESNHHSILTLNHDGSVDRWTGPQFEEPEKLYANWNTTSNPISGAICKESYRAAASFEDGSIRIIKLGVEDAILVTNKMDGDLSPISVLGFLDPDSLLLYHRISNKAWVWDIRSDTLKEQWGAIEGFWYGAFPNIDNYRSSDNLRMCFPKYGGGMMIRDLLTGNVSKKELPLTGITNAAFTPDGRNIALSTLRGHVHVFDTTDFEMHKVIGDLRLGILDLDFSNDSKRMVTAGCGQESVRILDYEHGLDLLTLPTDFQIFHTSFSPTDEYLIAVDTQDQIHIWRAPPATMPGSN